MCETCRRRWRVPHIGGIFAPSFQLFKIQRLLKNLHPVMYNSPNDAYVR